MKYNRQQIQKNKSFFLSLICFSVFLLPIIGQTESPQSVERYALYVASNEGGNDRATLRYAGTDAQRLSETMIEIGGIKKQNSMLLVDSTKAEIDGAFENMSSIIASNKAKAKRTEFIFYYSGHSDENALLLGNETYDYSSLKASISDIPSDVHVVMLDSCFSGNFIRAKGGSRQKSFLVDDSSVVQGHAYLSSSSESESSQESDSIGASYFTHSLITGLRGAADTSGDNKVSLNELYYYAFNDTLAKTEQSTIGPQHPSFNITLVGSGDLVLTDISEADSILVLPADVEGRYLVRTLEGKLASEINKVAGTKLALALPVGFYSVTVIGATSTSQATIKLDKGASYTLEAKGLRQIPLIAGTARGPSTNENDIDSSKQRRYPYEENSWDEVSDDEYIINQARKNAEKYDSIKKNTFESDTFFKPFVFSLFPGLSFPANSKNVMIAISPFMASQERIRGVQANSFMGIITTGLEGAQLSGFMGINSGFSTGAQCSGFGSITSGDFRGIQCAGFMNIATKRFQGVQTAGFMNISSGEINGSQISGFLNIAKKVSGLQLGFINIADENDGVSLGLLNFIKNGIMSTSLYFENDQMFIQYQGGTNAFFTTFLVGTADSFNFDYGILGAGIGSRVGKGFICFDFELLYKQIITTETFASKQGLLLNSENEVVINEAVLKEMGDLLESTGYPSARITANMRFSKHFGIFCSFNADLMIDGWNNEAFNCWNRNTQKWNVENQGFGVDYYWTFGLKF